MAKFPRRRLLLPVPPSAPQPCPTKMASSFGQRIAPAVTRSGSRLLHDLSLSPPLPIPPPDCSVIRGERLKRSAPPIFGLLYTPQGKKCIYWSERGRQTDEEGRTRVARKGPRKICRSWRGRLPSSCWPSPASASAVSFFFYFLYNYLHARCVQLYVYIRAGYFIAPAFYYRPHTAAATIFFCLGKGLI